MSRTYIGFGSNIGDGCANVRRAFELLGQSRGILKAELSKLYRSAPVGYLEQDWFVNGVGRFEIDLNCFQLLDLCREIESQMKRVREVRWGPRIIDLDIIWMEGTVVSDAALKIPHPRACDRAFVLKPLEEFDPELVLNGKKVSDWIKTCDDQDLEIIL